MIILETAGEGEDAHVTGSKKLGLVVRGSGVMLGAHRFEVRELDGLEASEVGGFEV